MPTDATPLTEKTMMDHYRKAIAQGGYPFPYSRLVGFRLTEVEPGRAVVEFEAGRSHWNTIGTLHGGATTSVADTAMGIAHGSLLEEGQFSTTVELKINFLKAIRAGRLRAEARVVKHGRTLTLVDCDVTDEAGRLVARASSTCMTLRWRPEHG